MSSPRRVVVTGLGLATPIGLDLGAFRRSLQAGRSGVRAIRSFDASALPVRIGAEIDDFDAKQFLEKKDRKNLKMMVRTIQLAVAGARLALDEGRLGVGAVEPARLGVVFGTGTIPGDLADLGPAAQASWDPARGEIDWRRWGGEGLAHIPPMWMLNHVPNMSACHVAIVNNAQGPNNTVTQSDAAGLLALGAAVRTIERDAADVILAGGADTHTDPLSLARYSLFGRLSRRNDEPERACRPFDRGRDGQVLGEGAGVFLVEDREHALRRQAPILAEVLSFVSAFDPGRRGSALTRAIRAALEQAGVGPQELDHVSAHAPGDPVGDAWEAHGVQAALGSALPVLALKSYFGNLGTGAGLVELAGSLLALKDGLLPANLNCDEKDPDCPVYVPCEPRPTRRSCVLKISATERGHIAVAVLRRWE